MTEFANDPRLSACANSAAIELRVGLRLTSCAANMLNSHDRNAIEDVLATAFSLGYEQGCRETLEDNARLVRR